jgi:hypothetical protein
MKKLLNIFAILGWPIAVFLARLVTYFSPLKVKLFVIRRRSGGVDHRSSNHRLVNIYQRMF